MVTTGVSETGGRPFVIAPVDGDPESVGIEVIELGEQGESWSASVVPDMSPGGSP
jgi:hypothetical protein